MAQTVQLVPQPMSADNLPAVAGTEPPSPLQQPKQEKKNRISKRLAEAIELMLTGECRLQKDAAARVNLNPQYLCQALAKPHVRVFYERRAREYLGAGIIRASARLMDLVDATSEHVSFDAAKHVLGVAGIKPASDPQVSVNIDIKAGYVIDLSEPSHGRSGTAAGTEMKQINGLADETG